MSESLYAVYYFYYGTIFYLLGSLCSLSLILLNLLTDSIYLDSTVLDRSQFHVRHNFAQRDCSSLVTHHVDL